MEPTREDLVAALRIAYPTPDSMGRSKYGMGMKTAACWIGKRWQVVTAEWSSGVEWTADIDVLSVAAAGNVPIRPQPVGTEKHYTEIVISNLNRHIQSRTEENIREATREVRIALLEADVALPVVQALIERIKVRAVGQEVLKSLTPGQALIKVVRDELTTVMGSAASDLNLNVPAPAVIH